MDKSKNTPLFKAKTWGWTDDWEKARVFSGKGPLKLHINSRKNTYSSLDLYMCELEVKIIGETKI